MPITLEQRGLHGFRGDAERLDQEVLDQQRQHERGRHNEHDLPWA